MFLSVLNLIDWMFILHPQNSMFFGYAPNNTHTIQTLYTWKEPVLMTIIFLLDCQRWAVCFTTSFSPYLLLFPPMVIEGGCRPVKVQSERVGVVEREKDRNRGDRRSSWVGQDFIQQRNMCTSLQFQFPSIQV